MSACPLLALERVSKVYRRGLLDRTPAFQLDVDHTFDRAARSSASWGPNGAGKTTLFEMIAGSNAPSAGRIVVAGQDMQRVRYRQRDRLAIHYHQSYQVRRFSKTKPSFLLEPAHSAYPLVHLFDEPQFNTQDGYIGFMLDFFRKLRGEGRLVFVCLHPTAPFQLEILREICERFLFVHGGPHGRALHLRCADSPARRSQLSRRAGSLSAHVSAGTPRLVAVAVRIVVDADQHGRRRIHRSSQRRPRGERAHIFSARHLGAGVVGILVAGNHRAAAQTQHFAKHCSYLLERVWPALNASRRLPVNRCLDAALQWRQPFTSAHERVNKI